MQALFEQVKVLGPNEAWHHPSVEAEARGWPAAMTGEFRVEERKSGRGALIIASLVGAAAALLATFVTLVITRWLDDRRWVREREHRELTARRAAYAKMSRTAAVWREAAVDLMGKPKKRDWDAYWAARDEAMQAGAELELIGSALAIETMGEALELGSGSRRSATRGRASRRRTARATFVVRRRSAAH